MSEVKIKRVYEAPDDGDGIRILVDRLWPRGLTKEKAGIDLWLKDVAPSTELRKWFGHDPARWEQFKELYHHELEANAEQVLLLKDQMKRGAVTLLFAAKDVEHNEAIILQEWLSR
jgi:Uncharacterized conserved protein